MPSTLRMQGLRSCRTISPALNPIELMFAMAEHSVRRAHHRTIDAVSHHVGKTLKTIESEGCASYLKNTGYASGQD
jgi:hypothetical protein